MSTFNIPNTFVNGTVIDADEHNDNWVGIKSYAEGISTGTNLDNGAVTTTKIADTAVTTAKLATSAVGTAQIADLAVSTAKIADSGVTTAKINALAVTDAKIADNAVTTAKINALAVTTAKIADANVTTAKIADANVTEAKIATNAVTTAKITDLNVTTAKIADSAITSAKIADATIVAADIANATITTAKLSTASGEIAGGWTTYTPATTNITRGASTLAGAYMLIGKTLFFRISLGSGATATSAGVISFRLPASLSAAAIQMVPTRATSQLVFAIAQSTDVDVYAAISTTNWTAGQGIGSLTITGMIEVS